MIIQVRGTSGSGKSWVMRQVMDALGGPVGIVRRPTHRGRRKLPLYYVLPSRVVVLGHYESPCGGCDTVGSARAVYELIQEARKAEPCATVLCEGLLLSEDVKWTVQMPDVRCLFLTTPVDVCLGQIRARRAAAGNAKPLNEANTLNRVGVVERARVKLGGCGIIVRRVTAPQAAGVILRWLREPALSDRRERVS